MSCCLIFSLPKQRTGQPKKSPFVALAALAGELTPEELETESAGGLQQKLERNHKDKSQLRTALGQNEHEAGGKRSADRSQADNRAQSKQAVLSSSGQAEGEVNPEQLDSAENTQRRFDQSQDKSQVRSAAGEQDTGSAEEARERSDAPTADGRSNKARKNPLAGLAPAPGAQTGEELEAESALGSQRRLDTRPG